MSTKMVNGVQVTMTQAEIDARAAEVAAWEAGAFDRAMDNLRSERNRKISETDYLALSDQPPMSQAMIDYRKALRDITDGLTTEAEVLAVVWPIKP